jgi:hypothetical protein
VTAPGVFDNYWQDHSQRHHKARACEIRDSRHVHRQHDDNRKTQQQGKSNQQKVEHDRPGRVPPHGSIRANFLFHHRNIFYKLTSCDEESQTIENQRLQIDNDQSHEILITIPVIVRHHWHNQFISRCRINHNAKKPETFIFIIKKFTIQPAQK